MSDCAGTCLGLYCRDGQAQISAVAYSFIGRMPVSFELALSIDSGPPRTLDLHLYSETARGRVLYGFPGLATEGYSSFRMVVEFVTVLAPAPVLATCTSTYALGFAYAIFASFFDSVVGGKGVGAF